MKIAIFNPYLDTPSGGEKYILTLAQCLSDAHAVSILWDSREEVKKAADRFNLEIDTISVDPNIFSPKFSKLQRLVASKKYDAIIYLSDGSIPIVLCSLYIHFQFPVEWITLTPITRLKLSRTARIFCNSEFTRSYVDQKLQIKSALIYPPVDIKKKDIPKENIIMHVGRFTTADVDYKKQHFMIETFKKMIQAGLRDWKLVMAVSVRSKELVDFQKMQQTAAGFPISFVVNATNDDLWNAYSKAKIYWHASGYGEDLVVHPDRAEHFGISTVEAMGAGAVPVVIRAGGQSEVVTDGKNGFLWETQEEFIHKTRQLIQDASLLEKVSKNAQESSRIYGIERFCNEVCELVK